MCEDVRQLTTILTIVFNIYIQHNTKQSYNGAPSQIGFLVNTPRSDITNTILLWIYFSSSRRILAYGLWFTYIPPRVLRATDIFAIHIIRIEWVSVCYGFVYRFTTMAIDVRQRKSPPQAHINNNRYVFEEHIAYNPFHEYVCCFYAISELIKLQNGYL